MDDFIKKIADYTEITCEDERSLTDDGISTDSELILVNKKHDELKIFKIDEGIVEKGKHKSCDFMVQHKDINHYTELKGTHYVDGFPQIAESIEHLNEFFDGNDCKAIIVAQHHPSIADYQIPLAESVLNKHVEDGICKEVIVRASPYFHEFS